jgi:hypothetical protein
MIKKLLVLLRLLVCHLQWCAICNADKLIPYVNFKASFYHRLSDHCRYVWQLQVLMVVIRGGLTDGKES